MRKLICGLICCLPLSVISQNYNPFVSQGIVSPAPLLPLEANGTGTISFIVGNSGSDPLTLVANQEMLVVITLSRGVPDNADPIDAIGGTYKSYFNWTYNPTIRTFQGTQNQTIPGGLNGAGTITISYKVTQNSPMLAPQNGFNCNITPPAYSNGINSLNDDQVSSYTWTSFTITGNVFDDADGYVDGKIDGVKTNADGNLYVSIVNSTNNIIATVPVDADGNYELFPATTGTYTLTLHTNPSGAATSSLPANYVNTAEGFGTTSDGVANGYIEISLTDANIMEANFAVDQLPQTEDINEMIQAGIAQGEKFVLDMAPLRGSDPEDGNAAGSLSTGYSFLITSLPDNANLYYDNVLIIPADVAAGTGTAFITNYDPMKLSVAFTVTPILGTTAIFTYVAVDAAQQRDQTAATYTITVTAVLPADNIVLSGQRAGSDVLLQWETLLEQGTDYFRIEKNTDGRAFSAIDQVIPAAGNSNQKLLYKLTDKNETRPVVLYRVRTYYKDGKVAISNIVVVRMNASNDKIQVFPNPVAGQYYISFAAAGKYKLQLMDAAGKLVMSKDVEININNLNLLLERGNIAAGNYHLNILNSKGVSIDNVKLIFIQR